MRYWGATNSEWGRRVYTDGSGLASASPELRRCGWAVVEMGPFGFPVRACYGPLPGRQTVPRAERYAGLWAIKVAPQGVEICSDHLSFVREGSAWDEELAGARGLHADIWREIMKRTEGQDRPKFKWVPAHRELGDVIASPQREIEDCLGNLWADFFAKVGSTMHKVADTMVMAEKAHITKCKKTWNFLARAVQIFGKAASVAQDPPRPPRIVKVGAGVSFEDHDLVYISSRGEWRCRRCCVSATSELTLRGLRTGSNRRCQPDAVQAWRAGEFFAAQPPSSLDPAVAVALAAAEGFLGPSLVQGNGATSDFAGSNGGGAAGAMGSAQSGGERPGPRGVGVESSGPSSPGTGDQHSPCAQPDDGLQVFRDLNHRPVRHGRVIICQDCACSLILPDGACRDLRRMCRGVSQVKSTRANHLCFLKNAARGRHPKTGVPLDPLPCLGPSQQEPTGVGSSGARAGPREPSSVGLEDAPDPALPPAAAEAHVLQLVAAALRRESAANTSTQLGTDSD